MEWTELTEERAILASIKLGHHQTVELPNWTSSFSPSFALIVISVTSLLPAVLYFGFQRFEPSPMRCRPARMEWTGGLGVRTGSNFGAIRVWTPSASGSRVPQPVRQHLKIFNICCQASLQQECRTKHIVRSIDPEVIRLHFFEGGLFVYITSNIMIR